MLDPNSKNAVVEVFKSFIRFIYFGIIGLIGAFLASLVASGSLNNIVFTVGNQHINAGFFIVAAVAAAAKVIDRYVHANQNIKANGIAPL